MVLGLWFTESFPNGLERHGEVFGNPFEGHHGFWPSLINMCNRPFTEAAVQCEASTPLSSPKSIPIVV